MSKSYADIVSNLTTQPTAETAEATFNHSLEDGTKVFITVIKSSATIYKSVEHPDGTKTKTTFYKDGSKTVKKISKDNSATISEYNLKGIVTRKYEIDNRGQQSGLDQSFWPNGNLHEETFYYADVPEGRFESFYENGKIKERGYYRNGQVEEITEYRKNGRVSESGSGGFSIGEGRMRKGYYFGRSGQITDSWDDTEDPWWCGLNDEFGKDQEEYLDEPDGEPLE
jgi:antitoxin component YwqK of YwqJK toxin-antitoxin module